MSCPEGGRSAQILLLCMPDLGDGAPGGIQSAAGRQTEGIRTVKRFTLFWSIWSGGQRRLGGISVNKTQFLLISLFRTISALFRIFMRQNPGICG